MNIKRYFYLTIHFSPNYSNEFEFIEDNLYLHIATKEIYRRRYLYDFGWGQEMGYELLPALSFNELICLIEHATFVTPKGKTKKFSRKIIESNNINQSNMFGAVSVIMQEHVEELINFLSEKIETDYFFNEDIRRNFGWFSFCSSKMREMGKIPGGNLTQSYEDILCGYDQWSKISEKVIFQVYG